MCGITGIFAHNEVGSFYMVNLAKAIDMLANRGPDARGYFIKDFVGLGHRRLSIIDTSNGANQPFKDISGRYVLVFNGEIFNYKELRQQLEQQGCSFRTTSDTEVLLELLIREGAGSLNKLIGFFAFAFYDQHTEELLVARDRFGVKPLVYYQDEDKFIFGSEMKSLLAFNIPRQPDMTSVYQYLQLNYIPGPHSIFKGVSKLRPGSYVRVRKKKVEEISYYVLPKQNEKAPLTFSGYDQLKADFLSLLEDSIQRRLISDVPLGAFLSGGIDSSTVVALAARHTRHLNTFSIGFRDEPLFDETKYAGLVAKRYETNHTVFQLSNQDIFEEIHQVLDYIDEPFADASALPFYVLSKRTVGKVKVALSGDGADEILGGYNRYYAELKAREKGFRAEMLRFLYPLIKKLPQSRGSYTGNKIRQLTRFAEGYRLNARDRYWRWSTLADEKQAWELLSKMQHKNFSKQEYRNRKDRFTEGIKEDGSLADVLYNDMHTLLPGDMLFKVDMMSMANGLEVREPFLDHRLVEFVFNLPMSARIDKGGRKKILKDVAFDLLPQELFNRPKQGFDVPLEKFYRQEFRRNIERDLLNKDFVIQQGIFDPEQTELLKQTIFSGGSFDQEQVWGVLVFQHWWKKYMS